MSLRGFSPAIIGGALVAIVPATASLAHHAAAVYFDTSTIIEVRGVISDVRWQNPHIGFTLTTREEGGETTDWLVESNSVSSLRQRGVGEDQLTIGELVTVAGWPARGEANRMSGNNVLFPDNRELILRGSGAYYFSDGAEDRLTVAEVDASDIPDPSGLGLFRTWSTVGGPGQKRLWNDSYPLTESAIAARDAWDPIRDNPAIRCEPKGMPGIMDPPYPMEFSDHGDTIVIRQEEFDTVRTVYMTPDATPSNPQRSILGHSVGHWEGETLVIETTHISWPFLDARGIPMSERARLEERYTITPNGRRLDLELTITDPEYLTSAVELTRFWSWMPGNQVQPYNCTPL